MPTPVASRQVPPLDVDERRRILSCARRLRQDEPAIDAVDVFGPLVRPGRGPGPALVFEDHSEITLGGPEVTESFKYRLGLLARGGDLLALPEPRHEGFESYMAERLGLGTLDVLGIPAARGPNQVPIARRLSEEAALFERIVRRARDGGGITLFPYMGLGTTWRLAAEIAIRAGVPVHVCAPPPRLAQRVNDKLWFASLVEALLGPRSLPPAHGVYGPAGLAARVARFARDDDRVVVKVPGGAGALGNLVVSAPIVRSMALATVRSWLLGLLKDLGWRDTYPLVAGVWEVPTLTSPSVQVWIPARADGPPVIEGIFTQVLSGSAGEFVGAEPVDLPSAWQDRLGHEALLLSSLLQELGFFGRCSFDALLAGGALETAELHWIESNARWGGVSIPMTLANRLVGDWRRHPFVIVQRRHGVPPGRSFSDVLDALSGYLFDAESGTGAVVLTPCGGEGGQGVHFMMIGETVEAARQKAEALASLFGVGGEER